MSSERPTVVIDNGSFNVKAGFSCDNHPISMFRNVVGRPKCLRGSYGREDYDVYLGDDAMDRTDSHNLNSPVVNGKIVDWNDMERIWHYIFYQELKAAPDDRHVLLTCSPTAHISEKIKCCEIFFESLNSPAVCIQPQCTLALYAFGVTSGISVDIGYENTSINPVYEGSVISYAQMQTNLGGNHISEYMKMELQRRSFANLLLDEYEIIENIKRKCLFITPDAALPRLECCKKYLLPDGNEINVIQETFMAAEMIFQPDLVLCNECNFLPLHKCVATSASMCDPDLRSELYDAVILYGGSSLIPGFASRLMSEISNITTCPIEILSSNEGYAVPWLGGAVFASLPDSTQMWVSKFRYEENGEKIVKKLFM